MIKLVSVKLLVGLFARLRGPQFRIVQHGRSDTSFFLLDTSSNTCERNGGVRTGVAEPRQ
jgi:hypothetical protein